jgi:hypothetical protein
VARPSPAAGAAAPAVPGGKNLFANAGFEDGAEPWFFSDRTEQRNLKRTYRRTSFLLARLLAGMGVAGSPPVLERFATPVGGRPAPSLVQNGDFRADADGDGTPDGWLFTSGSKQAACRREKAEDGAWAVVLACPPVEGGEKSGAMLAQHDLPVTKGRWCRISFKARARNLTGGSPVVAVQNMDGWRSCFEYQRFDPGEAWQPFRFDVQSKETAEKQTRFQIWYDGTGELWLSDVRVEPIGDPAEGRWLTGLYLDEPEEWDDPYRFFRW